MLCGYSETYPQAVGNGVRLRLGCERHRALVRTRPGRGKRTPLTSRRSYSEKYLGHPGPVRHRPGQLGCPPAPRRGRYVPRNPGPGPAACRMQAPTPSTASASAERPIAGDVAAVPAGLQGVHASMPVVNKWRRARQRDAATEPFGQLGRHKEVSGITGLIICQSRSRW
jgi:hypothetical protein